MSFICLIQFQFKFRPTLKILYLEYTCTLIKKEKEKKKKKTHFPSLPTILYNLIVSMSRPPCHGKFFAVWKKSSKQGCLKNSERNQSHLWSGSGPGVAIGGAGRGCGIFHRIFSIFFPENRRCKLRGVGMHVQVWNIWCGVQGVGVKYLKNFIRIFYGFFCTPNFNGYTLQLPMWHVSSYNFNISPKHCWCKLLGVGVWSARYRVVMYVV